MNYLLKLFSLTLLFSQVTVVAQYIVDQDVGVFTVDDSVTITGDTSAAGGAVRNNGQFHLGVTSIAGNWGNERVYQFELTEPALINLSLLSSTGDPDFILMDSLDVVSLPDTTKESASGALVFENLDIEGETSVSLRAYPPGTYYLSVESFDGFDILNESTPTTNAQFSIELSFLSPSVFELRQVESVISSEYEALSFATSGSSNDTILALYRDDDEEGGSLIAKTDNVGESELRFPDGLSAGIYVLAVGGQGADFFEDYGFTASESADSLVLSHSRGSINDPKELAVALDIQFDETAVKLFSFEVITPPAALNLGKIREENSPLLLSLLDSSELPDSEIALYDGQGFIRLINDDFDPEAGVTLSALDLNGLPEGTWYLAVTGWNHFFDNGFSNTVLGGGTTFGEYTLTYPTGSVDGDLDPGQVNWFRFYIGEPDPIQNIEITRDIESSEFLLSWRGIPGTRYSILASEDLGDFFPLVGFTELSEFQASIPFLANAEATQFFRVREEIK